IDILCSEWFNPRKTVILEEQGPPGSSDIEGSVCNILKYKDNRVEIEAKMTNSGYLVLTDSHYPGWKAYVDGKETHIYYANCAFRAVFLEKGEHKVSFVYSAGSFKKGAAITLATIFLIAAAILFGKRQRLL
ncbi:YfhO family protein, partial [bacterium]|nr:YfhO family protein [bacterium]